MTDLTSESHILVIKRNNYERLINGEPLVFDGANFGLMKPLTVIFAETEADALKQFNDTGHKVKVMRTKLGGK